MDYVTLSDMIEELKENGYSTESFDAYEVITLWLSL